MSWFSRILGREERAAETRVRSDDPFIAEFFGQRGGLGGYFDPSRASGLAVAASCISTVSQALASVPLHLHRRTDNGGRDRAADHPLYGALHDAPNGVMTAFEAREMLIASLMIAGNAYARLDWNGRGQVVALHPLDPGSVTVERLESGRLRYRVTDRRGGVAVYLQEEMLHLRYRLARDGVMGLSPIQIARESFNLALTQQEQAGKQAQRAFRPEGALTFANSISGAGKDRALALLRNKIEANNTTSGVLVLDGGASWQSFAFNSKDSEFLESRKLSNLDVCRIWNVPPSVAGITDNATYSNIGEESRARLLCAAWLRWRSASNRR